MIKRALEDELDALDLPYETGQERKIGRVLDQYGIPFFYKQPTVILNPDSGNNEIWKPSFTLPQYGCLVIDYVMNPQEQDKIIQTYRYNQIPAVVLGPEDLDRPHWQQNLYSKMQNHPKVPEYGLDQLLKS